MKQGKYSSSGLLFVFIGLIASPGPAAQATSAQVDGQTRPCTIANGSGAQTYSAATKAWGKCVLSSCNAGYTAANNRCFADTIACATTRGSGTRTFNGSAYNRCMFTACNEGYSLYNSWCFANTKACTVPNGSGSATFASGRYGACVATTCDSGYSLEGGKCVASGSSFAWQDLQIGAGGYIIGMDQMPDGTMAIRTDTYGAYLWNPGATYPVGNAGGTGAWQQLVNAASMPAGDVFAGNGGGVYEIRVAPSNTQVFYMNFGGYLYRSANRGGTWAKTNCPQMTGGGGYANDGYRTNGYKMAIDPINPNVVYIGTPKDGVRVTTDGGNTCAVVAGIPAGRADQNGNFPGITGMAFDPSAGVTNGKTNTLYVVSFGNGVYRTTDAGASFAALNGGPTQADHAVVANGIYYVVSNGSPAYLFRYKQDAWTQLLTENGQGLHTVAIDPFNPDHILVGGGGGTLQQSDDGGVTWSGWGWNSTHLAAADVPWLANNETYMSSGNILFDPNVQNKVWAADGVGVWYTNIPPRWDSNWWQTVVTWQDMSVGIEQLVANEIVVPPGGKPVTATWDRPFFYIDNPHQYPLHYSSGNNSAGNSTITAGWSIDYASSNPNVIVGIAEWWGVENSGYSTDGGQTWNRFPSSIPNAAANYMGGTIAASTPSNIIWAPADNQIPYYTKDGGITWNQIFLPGVSSWNGFDWAYYLKARTVVADRVLPNTFYFYFSGNGLFRSGDGGATWTKMLGGSIEPWDGYNAKLASVPGEAGHLFLTPGPEGAPAAAASGNFPFMHSVDGGATWTAIPNVTEVYAYGFGAPKQAGGYPAIFIAGWVNNVYGIYQSDDEGQTWNSLGQYPLGSLDLPVTISGDPNVYGEIYIGFSGSGYAFYGPQK